MSIISECVFFLTFWQAGVKLTPKGQIVHTDSQTTAPNIYAVGDATVDIALVNIAEIEGKLTTSVRRHFVAN